MKAWENDPENQKVSIKGDDRTPAWRWLGYAYNDGQYLGMSADNLMTTLREGGAKVPTGKRGATYKRQSQSGLVVNEILWPIETTTGLIPWQEVLQLREVNDYPAQEAAVQKFGFELFAKRAKIGAAKHVRVRPRFNSWRVAGTITIMDETITKQVLSSILDMAGMYCGLGDWRPSAPSKPGPWGRFTAEIKEA